jgi:hypothetical protein
VACACLDTSRRRFAPPSQAHASQNQREQNENSKPSDAESHAKPLSATLALTLSANLNFTRFLLFIFAGVFPASFILWIKMRFSFFKKFFK